MKKNSSKCVKETEITEEVTSHVKVICDEFERMNKSIITEYSISRKLSNDIKGFIEAMDGKSDSLILENIMSLRQSVVYDNSVLLDEFIHDCTGGTGKFALIEPSNRIKSIQYFEKNYHKLFKNFIIENVSDNFDKKGTVLEAIIKLTDKNLSETQLKTLFKELYNSITTIQSKVVVHKNTIGTFDTMKYDYLVKNILKLGVKHPKYVDPELAKEYEKLQNEISSYTLNIEA